jgi:hypothetical protein
MAVQDELRPALRKMGVACPPGLLSQARIVALGGMSESGKSTAADWLRRRHGYARLKIGFLLDTSGYAPPPGSVPAGMPQTTSRVADGAGRPVW